MLQRLRWTGWQGGRAPAGWPSCPASRSRRLRIVAVENRCDSSACSRVRVRLCDEHFLRQVAFADEAAVRTGPVASNLSRLRRHVQICGSAAHLFAAEVFSASISISSRSRSPANSSTLRAAAAAFTSVTSFSLSAGVRRGWPRSSHQLSIGRQAGRGNAPSRPRRRRDETSDVDPSTPSAAPAPR